MPDPKRALDWRPWAWLVAALVVGVLLVATKARPLVIGGVALVLICLFILGRLIADRVRTRR